MRVHAALLVTSIAFAPCAAAQDRPVADSTGGRALATPGETRTGSLRRSCSGAWIDGCLESSTQRALILLGFMSGAVKPVGVR